MKKILILTIALLSFIGVSAKLEEVFKWKTIDWQWPNEQARSDAIKNGNFVPGGSMPNALLPWKDKLFVTVPRYSFSNHYCFALSNTLRDHVIYKYYLQIFENLWINPLPSGDPIIAYSCFIMDRGANIISSIASIRTGLHFYI